MLSLKREHRGNDFKSKWPLDAFSARLFPFHSAYMDLVFFDTCLNHIFLIAKGFPMSPPTRFPLKSLNLFSSFQVWFFGDEGQTTIELGSNVQNHH